MIKKERKLNMVKVKACIIIVIVLLLIIIISIISNIKKSNNKYKDLTVLLNNEFIETLNKVIVDEEKNIYFSKEDIQKLFDETIYFNEAEKELITTYDTHIALLKIEEEYALIDDENIKLNGNLKEIDKKIYLPITDLENVYDIELEYSEKSNRVIIDSTLKSKKESSIKKRTKMYEKSGFFNGKKLENLIIGDKVVILEEAGKYTKVRTALGNIGYIKTKKIGDILTIRDDRKEEKKELVVYSNYSNISGIYEDFSVDTSKLNVVIPTFFYVDKNDKVLDKTTSSTATYAVYKNWTEKNNLQIMPVLTNNESVSSTLLSYSQRTQIINSLKNMIINYNYMGINIKFDTVDDINSFYRFILELYPRFKAAGIKVGITLKNTNLDKERIENSVDYIIED